jgi:hypothetical protein
MEHREAALRLVEHWKREAERQAQFAQVPPPGLHVHACCPAAVSALRRQESMQQPDS